MEKLINKNFGSPEREYEIVTMEELPSHYIVWNIGRENFPFPGYIPMAELAEPFHIDPETLKTVKVESEELALAIMRAATTGRFKRADHDRHADMYKADVISFINSEYNAQD